MQQLAFIGERVGEKSHDLITDSLLNLRVIYFFFEIRYEKTQTLYSITREIIPLSRFPIRPTNDINKKYFVLT